MMKFLRAMSMVSIGVMGLILWFGGVMFWGEAIGTIGIALAVIFPPLSVFAIFLVMFSSFEMFFSYLAWFAVMALLAYFVSTE